jgi:FAD/FMN-containing dehydrogenase
MQRTWRTVEVARESGVPLFVRDGGHHAVGHSTGDGLLLDLGSLTALEVDGRSATAWAGGGSTAGAVTRSLAGRGRAVGFGDTGTVGIGGVIWAGGWAS